MANEENCKVILIYAENDDIKQNHFSSFDELGEFVVRKMAFDDFKPEVRIAED